MDILTVIAIIMAFVVVVIGAILKHAGALSLISMPAAIVVLVGTATAVVVQTPKPVLLHFLKIIRWVVFPPQVQTSGMLTRIIEWSEIARRQGLLGLEPAIEVEADVFARKGLQMLVDGTEPEALRGILEVEKDAREHVDMEAAKVIEAAGIYAPTLGIVGAVLGLMGVMQNLADPSALGPGIAGAFVSTIYGIASANLLFLPMANKLKSLIRAQSTAREMMIEGLVSIAEGENPRNIESKLQGFLH
ncbi:MAG: flagellar motor protein [Gammaproteobacteria bacterium HGW-Gammaproteobacteria-2]|jgi:chemotaxis protein MotA|nr:MAG: flagellar motor protein [Gammaproteobacteria bacterium HGW-Gammaproteobacteria-2]